MALNSLDDIKTWLPSDKFKATDGNVEITLIETDVERTIKGYLSSVFSQATLETWADPDATPAYIRSCAGRLVAAFYYAKKLSEDMPDWDRTYPQRLYDEAMTMLEDVRTGQVTLSEVDEPIGTGLDNSFFYPDSTTEPKFTMDMRW